MALHRGGFPLCRRLLRLSTVVCETLSTRAMARMPSPFSAKACTWRSNFLPNALALAPKCSMASAFKNGQIHAAASDELIQRNDSSGHCVAGDVTRHDQIDPRQGAMVFLQTTTAGTARKFMRRMAPRCDRGSQRCIVRRTGPVGPHAVLAALGVWPDVGRSAWALRYPDPRRRS